MVAACTPAPDPHSEAAHGRKVMALQEKRQNVEIVRAANERIIIMKTHHSVTVTYSGPHFS